MGFIGLIISWLIIGAIIVMVVYGLATKNRA